LHEITSSLGLCRIFDGEPDPLHRKMHLFPAAFLTVNRTHFTEKCSEAIETGCLMPPFLEPAHRRREKPGPLFRTMRGLRT
jgi:hypothetical protein